MAVLRTSDPTQFDVGGSLTKTDPSTGETFYFDGHQWMPVPAGMRPVQTNPGGGYFSPEQLQLMGLSAIGGIAGAGAAGAGAAAAGEGAAAGGTAGGVSGGTAAGGAVSGASAVGNALDSDSSSGGSDGTGVPTGVTGTDTSTPGWWNTVLRGLPGLIGAVGANRQTQAYRDLANRYLEMGQPYRDRLAALYADPNSFLTSKEVTVPVQQGTDALARSLSVQGNPIGSGHALQELQDYSANQLFGKLGQEKDRLAGYGGLSAYNAAAPGAAGQAVGSQGNVWNAVGAGAGAVFNPQPSLVDIFRSMRGLA
jgi:hypothetical protein